ncbi:hypothetical protein [Ruminococcus sp.]|uniref:hypothetical protein n=1 Tax=Ruminococcus sp. TaxID=41978 RepID=UPI0025DECDCA|nr:hypothetical protein [Ruminococcus sp.]
MKYLKISLAILLSISFLLLPSSSAMAHGREKHDEILFKAFFPLEEHDLKSGTKIKEIREVLSNASYLSIDQHNTNSGDDEKLKKLKDFGVKGLPTSIYDSDYRIQAYGEDHRRFTHRGWDPDKREVEYNTEELAKWIIRKPILENTVDKVFDFNGDTKKRDSFCAIIYYIHILGDKEYDCNNLKYYEPERIILELGGRPDKADIIDELIYYISILFKDQKSTQNYTYIISKLNEINSELKPIVKNVAVLKNSNSDEFKKYKACTDRTLSLIRSDNFSLLLKGETFFNKVFYNHPY